MTYDEFSATLKRLNLKKDEFAKMVNMNHTSILNWKNKKIPDWVEPFLNYYEEATELRNVIKTLNKYKF